MRTTPCVIDGRLHPAAAPFAPRGIRSGIYSSGAIVSATLVEATLEAHGFELVPGRPPGAPTPSAEAGGRTRVGGLSNVRRTPPSFEEGVEDSKPRVREPGASQAHSGQAAISSANNTVPAPTSARTAPDVHAGPCRRHRRRRRVPYRRAVLRALDANSGSAASREAQGASRTGRPGAHKSGKRTLCAHTPKPTRAKEGLR